MSNNWKAINTCSVCGERKGPHATRSHVTCGAVLQKQREESDAKRASPRGLTAAEKRTRATNRTARLYAEGKGWVPE